MTSAGPRRCWRVALWWLLFACLAGRAAAADTTGAALYRAGCANCHGPRGAGAPRAQVAFAEPLPDFGDCSFATREPDDDWLAIVHDGGPARAFARMMPAFGDALPVEQIARILAHVRTFCADARWPRGELNLPRPLVTEKAFPEDEVVVSAAASAEGNGAVNSKFIYERRFGPRNQIELVVPIAFHERAGDGGRQWIGGAGDVAIAVKRAMYHSLERGTILSAAAELILPTGDSARGLGKGTTVVEPFLAFGQMLPLRAFVQVQAGLELPADTNRAGRDAFWRVAAGRSFSQRRWGRTWSPMVELVGARELAAGERAHWDIVPQLQVTLSTRQHVMANVGVRAPVGDTAGRPTQLLMYVLWDWFDGPLFGGW
jgi:mono/diheme cytochrome c family protein